MKPENFAEFRRKRELNLQNLRKNYRMENINQLREKSRRNEETTFLVSDLAENIKYLFSENLFECTKGAYFIRNILRTEFDPPVQKIIDSGVIPVLISLIKRFDYPDLQYEAAWALSNIASGEQQYTKVLIDHGIVPSAIELLDHPQAHINEQGI